MIKVKPTHRKNRMVTIVSGHRLCRNVSWAALVTWSFLARIWRLRRKLMTPILKDELQQALVAMAVLEKETIYTSRLASNRL